jgi:hypothetical protein
MRQRALIVALLLIGIGIGIGATVFRTDIAQATGLAQAVTIDNTASNPVPVREQNRDGSGNIKVHEQGTANVNIANTSLPASGNRLIQIADQVTSPSDRHTTSWVDTRDCRRIVGYIHSGQQIVYELRLQVTTDPNFDNGQPLATYTRILDDHLQAQEYTITTYSNGTEDEQPDSQPVVAPYSRGLIQLVGVGLGVQDVSAWLYCIR